VPGQLFRYAIILVHQLQLWCRHIEQPMAILQQITARAFYIPYAIAQRVRAALGLNLFTIPQYAIFVSAVEAHRGYLAAQGRAQVDLDERGMIWQAANG
jgi:hypothetical protein